MVFNQTPFYGESGGQIGDTGVACSCGDGRGIRQVSDDCIKKARRHVHLHLGTLADRQP